MVQYNGRRADRGCVLFWYDTLPKLGERLLLRAIYYERILRENPREWKFYCEWFFHCSNLNILTAIYEWTFTDRGLMENYSDYNLSEPQISYIRLNIRRLYSTHDWEPKRIPLRAVKSRIHVVMGIRKKLNLSVSLNSYTFNIYSAITGFNNREKVVK